MDNADVWRDIRVEMVPFSTWTFWSTRKDVFKTYSEIDQMDIIYQAANVK